jgi:hypothetical protein
MTTQGTKATGTPPGGFWKLRHAVIGLGALVLIVILMVRSCGNDESEQQSKSTESMPRQAIAVQIPASQWPATQQAPVQTPAPQQPGYGYLPQQPAQQPGYGYAPQQPAQQPGYGYAPQQPVQQPGYGYAPQQPVQQPRAPLGDGGNPWAVQSQPYSYGQSGYQQWGQQQLQRPQPQQQYYAPPPVGSQYRPLESEQVQQAPQPQPAPPVQGYYPAAPYDRLSGSSFGTPAYSYGGAYGGAYPGYYGTGVYGAPGGVYSPGWGTVPGLGWPGVW